MLVGLLQRADVFVHGYRADALDSLGLDAKRRREACPCLVDIALNAYGWSGPWRNRRGFDSLVQMSGGIAEFGMRRLGRDRPTPLPVQALDHATGYLMAAAAVRGLAERAATARGFEGRASLARTAQLLISVGSGGEAGDIAAPSDEDWSPFVETTDFGPVHRLKSPVLIGNASLRWERGAAKLGSSPPAWW